MITSNIHSYSVRLYLFAVLMVFLPCGIGFKFGTVFPIWVILSLIFLFPSFLAIMIGKEVRLDKIDILVLTLVFLSSFFTYFEKDSFKSMLGAAMRNFLTMFMPYFAGKYFIKRDTEVLGLLYAFSIAAGVIFLMALYEYASGQAFFRNLSPALYLYPEDEWRNSVITYIRFGRMRVTASFSQPLYLGTYFGLVALFNMFLFFESKRIQPKLGKVLLPLVIVIASLGLLLTQARTAMLALGISIGLLMINQRKRVNWRIILPAIILPVIVFFFISNWFSGYFDDFIYYGVTSESAAKNLTGRMESASQSLSYVFQNANWFGESFTKIDALRWFYESTDLLQGFINPFLRNGIIFALLYIYIWFFTIRYLAKRWRVNWRSSLCLVVMIYLFIVNNITALNMQNEIILYIFWGLSINRSLANIDKVEAGLSHQ